MKSGGECLMKDDLEPQMNDDDLMDFKELNGSLKDELEREVKNDNSTPSLKGRRIRPSSNNLLPILMGILIVVALELIIRTYSPFNRHRPQ